MCPLAVGAQLMQYGWVCRALALRENASHIVEQRHHLGWRAVVAYKESTLKTTVVTSRRLACCGRL